MLKKRIIRPSLPAAVYWLITRNEGGRRRTLIIDHNGEQMLPVFSFTEEAVMFLWSGTSEEGWQVKESSARELLSILYGPGNSVEWIALDPLPEMVTGAALDLVSMRRDRFMEHVLGRSSLPA